MKIKKRVITEKWFEDDFKLLDIFRFVRYMQNSSCSKLFINEKKFFTLFINLKLDNDELFKNLKKGTKVNIRRAKRDGVEWEIYKNKNFDDYLLFSNKFRDSKNLSLFSIEALSPYLDNMITFRLFNNKNKTLVFLSCLVDKDKQRVRPLYIASTTELDEVVSRTLVGYANTYAYWLAIEYFQKQGFKIFDMGGIAPNDKDNKLLGITKFKMGFNQKIIEENNFISPLLYFMIKLKSILIK